MFRLTQIHERIQNIKFKFADDSATRIHDIQVFAKKHKALEAIKSAADKDRALMEHITDLEAEFKLSPSQDYDEQIDLLFKTVISRHTLEDGSTYYILSDPEHIWVRDRNNQIQKIQFNKLPPQISANIFISHWCRERTLEDLRASSLAKKSKAITDQLNQLKNPLNIAKLIVNLPPDMRDRTETLLLDYKPFVARTGCREQINEYIIILNHCLLQRGEADIAKKIQLIQNALMRSKSKRLDELQRIYFKLILILQANKTDDEKMQELKLFIVESYLKNRGSVKGGSSRLGNALQNLILREFKLDLPRKIQANEAYSTLSLLPSQHDFTKVCSDLKTSAENLGVKFAIEADEQKHDLSTTTSFVSTVFANAKSLFSQLSQYVHSKFYRIAHNNKEYQFRTTLADHHIFISATYKPDMHQLRIKPIQFKPKQQTQNESRYYATHWPSHNRR